MEDSESKAHVLDLFCLPELNHDETLLDEFGHALPKGDSHDFINELDDYSIDNGKRKLSPSSETTQIATPTCESNFNLGRKTRNPRRRPSRKTWETTSKFLCGDGYAWRKYGEKSVLGTEYPRSYYRCTDRHSMGCMATKQVQQLDSGLFKTVYHEVHSCCRTTNDTNKLAFDVHKSISSCDLERKPDANKTMNCSTMSSSEVVTEESFMSSIKSEIESSAVPFVFDFTDHDDHPSGSGSEKVNPFHQPREGNSWTKKKLMEALFETRFKTIGIYGSAGVGKTTSMKHAFTHCKTNQLFDLFLWVTLSSFSSRRKIQKALVEQLELEMPNAKTDDEVAMFLVHHIETKNFVVFLDDVRENIDLVRIGIPVPSEKSKIIMSTRSMVVCLTMGVEKTIKAKALSNMEALQLLRHHVGDVMDLVDINHYARAIIDECSGLPLMIKVVGSALKMKFDVSTWKRFLKDVLLTNNLRILKLGYDRLQDHHVKSCFLYLALLTKGKVMRLSSLVDHLIEEGFVEESMPNARKKAHDIITKLINASLLELSDQGFVNMNYMICDLALLVLLSDKQGLQLLLSRYFRPMWSPVVNSFDIFRPTLKVPESPEKEFIPPENNQFILTPIDDNVDEPPLDREWEESRIACLVDNTFSHPPKNPPCSKLVTLFLQRNNNLRVIPPSFFDNMSSLQILNLSKTRIKTLPLSLSKLESLQALVLRNCERLLFLPSIIGALKQLLVLDVQGTEIAQIPDEMAELSWLTNLYVSFYGPVDEAEYAMLPSQLISEGTISSLGELRELSITIHPGDPRWTKDASHVLIEVSSLNLSSLSIHFPETQHLEYFINESPAWTFGTLNHFNFVVGHDVKRIVSHVSNEIEHNYDQQDRCLRFVNSEGVPEVVSEVLSNATAFYLDHHLGVDSLSQFVCDNANKLKFCIVRDCPQLKVIINGNKLEESSFESLEHLSIHYSWDLRNICVGPIWGGSFSKLRRLLVYSCPKLEYVLSYSMVATLSSLEELVIEDCQSLKQVVDHDRSSIDDDDIVIESEYVEFDVFRSRTTENAVLMIKVLKLHYLPKLKNISERTSLLRIEHLSFYNCPLLRNLHLKTINELTLKKIKAETDWWNALKWDNPDLREKLNKHVEKINVDDIWGKV